MECESRLRRKRTIWYIFRCF